MVVSLLFTGKGLLETKESLEPVSFMSPVIQEAMSSFRLLLVQSSKCGTYPGEDWQIGFPHIPSFQGFKYFLIFIDSFTGWIEAFPNRTEKATEVA